MEIKQTEPFLTQPLAVDDPEVFARVWRRVMPEEEQSPIALGAARREEQSRPEEEREARQEAPLQEEPPQEEELPCLGEQSQVYVPLLEERMEQAHWGGQSYQALTRRMQGAAGRQVSILAAEQQRYVRQLGAVYFLLTGRRWQSGVRAVLPQGTPAGILREMFAWEQRTRRAYDKIQTEDPCLSALFQELSGEAQLHMDAIRRILERT